MSDTRELHDRAMDLFEQGLLTARAGRSAESRNLFTQALEREAAAADSVASDHALEPTRSILHRSAASMALRIGDVQKAKQYVEAGLAGDPPEEIRQEMAVYKILIRVLSGLQPSAQRHRQAVTYSGAPFTWFLLIRGNAR